jgi:hypothetical protein
MPALPLNSLTARRFNTMPRFLLSLLLTAMPLLSHAIEEPGYEVVRKLDTVAVSYTHLTLPTTYC